MKLTTLSILILLANILSGQGGFNMPNTAESITTDADSAYLVSMLPEGGSFVWRDRYDKLNESPEDIIAFYNYMQRNNRSFSDIFVASDSVPVQQNIDAIKSLQSAGISVPVCEFVNEAFYPAGGYNYDWTKYRIRLSEFVAALHAQCPTVKIGIPIAPKPLTVFTKEQGGSRSHDRWNDSVYNWITAHPAYPCAVIIHIYYTGGFVPALGANTSDETGKTSFAFDKQVYTPSDTTTEGIWREIYRQSDPAVFWEPILNYCADYAVPTYVTECGYVDAGSLNGTWAYAAKAFEIINKYGEDSRISALCFHAGITRSTVGVVSPRKSFDVRDSNNSHNAATPTYDAFGLYYHATGKKVCMTEPITSAGTYSVWYLNDGAAYTPVINATGFSVTINHVDAIQGDRYSAVNRSMSYMLPGSVIDPFAVSQIYSLSEVPAMSFGYISITVAELPVIIKPCTRKWWQIFKPKCK